MMRVLVRWARSPSALEFAKYVSASAAALLVDYGVYWLIARKELLTLPQAAVVGYLAGLVVAYFLISGRIFKEGWLKSKKIYELLLFVGSGLLGTAITYGTVKLYVLLIGSEINQAKFAAIVVSFFSVYCFRKWVVFRRSSS